MLIVRRLISLMKPLVERFPRIENLYRALRYQSILKKPPSLTSWGFNLAGNSLMEQGTFEPIQQNLQFLSLNIKANNWSGVEIYPMALSNELQPDGVAMNPNFKSIFQLFFENGYQAFSVDGNMTPVTMEQVDLILKESLRPTTHNYIFCESKAALQALGG